MIEVEQRQLWRPDDHPDGPQRGDCMRACVASVFEVPYEETEGIDGTAQTLWDWMRPRFPGLTARQRVFQGLGDEPERIGDHVNWPTYHHEPGYWIAGIWSPRIPDREVFGCGCADRVPGGDPACEWCHGEPDKRSHGISWGLHAVVMENARLAWDPHPLRDPNMTLYFSGATTFQVTDPAKIPMRCQKGACGEGLIDPQDCYHRRAA